MTKRFGLTIRSMRGLGLAILLCGCGPSVRCDAAIIHSGADPTNAIVLGDAFPAVMWGAGFNQNGRSVNLFSGVLIDPHWVLTAANIHQGSEQTSAVAFGPGSNRTNDLNLGEDRYSSEIYIHPSYGGVVNNQPIGIDLALVYFYDPFPQTAATLYRGELPLGDYSVVGYGASGYPNGPLIDDGWNRGGVQVVEGTWPDNDRYFYSEFVDESHPNYRPLGSLVQPGDVGGGWFYDDGDGFQLVGITSGNFVPEGTLANDYGNWSVAVRLDLDWIDSMLYPGIASRDHSPASLPEPSAVAFLVVGGLLVTWRRARRTRQARRSNEARRSNLP